MGTLPLAPPIDDDVRARQLWANLGAEIAIARVAAASRPRRGGFVPLCMGLAAVAAVVAFFATNVDARRALRDGVAAQVHRAAPADEHTAVLGAPAADGAVLRARLQPILGGVSWQPSSGNRVWGGGAEAPLVVRAPQAGPKPPPVAAAPKPARPTPAPVVAAAPVPRPAVSHAPPPARASAAAPRPAAAPSEDDAAALEMARQAKAHLDGTL
jgi:hypothetical protein